MRTNWNTFWKEKRNRMFFLVSLLALSVILFSFLHFLRYNESRTGLVFNDPILALYTPLDISLLIFIITYSLAIAGLTISLNHPLAFIKLIQAYSLLIVMRMLCMYLLPLEPPVLIIPLQDVFLEFSFYSGRENLKDLFFSGHTATIFLFAFCSTNKYQKWLFSLGAILVGALLVLQHVHYSIDIIVAPLFAFLAVKLQKRTGFM